MQAGKEESVSIDVYAEEGYDTATLYFSLGRKTGDTSIPDASVVTISDISLVDFFTNMLPANAFGDNATAGTKVKKSYTSGRISTQNLKTFTYGRFEVRAKVPDLTGIPSAF